MILIVTSDHETGGLSVPGNNGAGTMPDVNWSTTGHTGVDVPFYVEGYGEGCRLLVYRLLGKETKEIRPNSLIVYSLNT